MLSNGCIDGRLDSGMRNALGSRRANNKVWLCRQANGIRTPRRRVRIHGREVAGLLEVFRFISGKDRAGSRAWRGLL